MLLSSCVKKRLTPRVVAASRKTKRFNQAELGRLAHGEEERIGGFDLKAAAVGWRNIGGSVGAAVAGVRAAGAAAALCAPDGTYELETIVVSD